MWGEQINEGFEGSWLPDGWSDIHVSGSASWAQASSGWSMSAHGGSYFAKMNYASPSHENYLVTPQLAPKSGESLSFYLVYGSSGTTTMTVEVSTKTAAKADFETVLSTYTTFPSTWQEQLIDLSAYVGQNIYIAFHVVDEYGKYICIDDVSGVSLKPETCPKTSTPTASNITTTSATISWTAGGTESEWNLQYKESSASDWISVTGLTSTTYELTGLEAGKVSYDYQVQADCGGDESTWRTGESFKTECGTITEFPKAFAFKGMVNNQKPDCWETLNTTNYYAPAAYTEALRFYGNNTSGYRERKAVAILPSCGSDISSLKAKIKYKNYSTSTSYPEFIIGYITNISDITTFVPLDTLDRYSSNFKWSEFVNMTGAPANSYIAIALTNATGSGNNTNYYHYIDTVIVDSNLDCSKPEVTGVSERTSASAKLTWGAKSGVTSYQYCAVAHGSAADWSGNLTTSNNYVTVSGLSAGTSYDFYVKCVCGGDASDAYEFSTTAACPTPSDIVFSNETYNSITVSWTKGGDETSWNLEYQQGELGWVSVLDNPLTSTTYNLSGLITGVPYTVRVQAACGSAWVVSSEFTLGYTEPAPTVTSITDVAATASWDAVADNDGGYEYSLVARDVTPSAWTGTTELFISWNNLTPGTEYDFYVRTKYGESASSAVKVQFATQLLAPATLTKGDVDGSSAAFSWTSGGAAPKYQWACVAKDASTDGQWSGATTDLSATATGLSALTYYDFYVRSWYADGVYSAPLKETFQTGCGIITIPAEGWSYNFKDDATGSGKIPQCWSAKQYVSGYTTYPYVSSGSAHSEGKCLYFNGGSSSSAQSIILPEFDADLRNYTLSFYYNNGTTDPDYASLTVGYYATDGDYSTAFTQIGEALDVVNGYTYAEFNLKDMPEGKKFIVINYAGSSYQHSAYIDDLHLELSPACARPSGLVCTDTTAHGGTFSWTENGSATAWVLEYSTSSTFASDVHEVAATTNPFTISSGMTANTKYYVRVKSDCGGETSGYTLKTVSVITDCEAYTVTELAPFTEGFETTEEYAIPGCWSRTPDDNSIGAYANSYYTTYSHTGSKCMRLYGGTSTSELLLVLPEFTGSLSALTLDFYYKASVSTTGYYSYIYGKPIIGYINTSDVFVGLDTLDQASAYTHAEFPFPASFEDTPANIAIKYATGSSTGYLYIDDIIVKLTPNCQKPANLACAATSDSKAFLSWTKGDEADDAWKVEYSKNSDFSASTIVDAAINSNFEISGLDADAIYYARVATNCGSMQSEPTDAVSFRTKCEPTVISAINPTWSADFTGLANNVYPACWDNSASTATKYSGTTDAVIWGVYNEMIRMKNFHAEAGTALINTPLLTLPDDKDYELTFSYANNANCGPLKVFVSTDFGKTFSDALGTYAESGIEDYENASNMSEATISLAAYRDETILIQFYSEANFGQGAIFVDNVDVHKATTCFKTTNLSAASNITPEGASFSWWKSGHGETQWQWAVAEEGDAPVWSGNIVDDTVATVNGLDIAKSYVFYVRSYCGSEDQSAVVASAAFSPVFTAPVANVTGATHVAANASWTASAYATGYNYCVVPAGEEATWNKSTTETSATLTGLAAESSYDFYVRAFYNTSFSTTLYATAEKVNFGTQAAPIEVTNAHKYEVTFETGVPADWTKTGTSSASYEWKSYTDSERGKCLRFDSNNNPTGKTSTVTTPLIQLNAVADLTFWCKNPTGGEYKVEMYNATDDETITLYADLAGIDNWTEKVYNLSAYEGKIVQFSFTGTSNYGANGGHAYLYLDDVRVIRTLALVDNANNESTLATLVSEGNSLDLTINRTLYCDGDYNTICLPFDLPTLDGTPLAGGELWAFRYGYVENGELLMRIAPASSIEAGVPYLITFTSGANIVNPIFTNVTISKSAGVSVGQTDDVQFIGILKPQPFTENDKNNLFVATGGMLAWSEAQTGAANSYLRSFRGYFHTETAVSGTPVSNHMPARIVRGEQVATGFDDVHGDVQSLKLLENGRVVIIRNGVKYSVQGQVISK